MYAVTIILIVDTNYLNSVYESSNLLDRVHITAVSTFNPDKLGPETELHLGYENYPDSV